MESVRLPSGGLFSELDLLVTPPGLWKGGWGLAQILWCFGTANIWPNRSVGWAISRSVAPF